VQVTGAQEELESEQEEEQDEEQEPSDMEQGILWEDDESVDVPATSFDEVVAEEAPHNTEPDLYCSNENEDYDTFTVAQKSIVKLMYILNEMEAPDYAFQSIMEWAQECYLEGFDFNPSMTRKANLKWMYKAIHNALHFLPHLHKIKLPDPLPNTSHLDVICL
jgi:hypothetical protein